MSSLNRTPVNRLRAYFDAITALLKDASWRYGCLVENMSLEAAEHSEALRARLVDIMASLTVPFADAVRAGQSAGEIRNDLEAEDVAVFLLSAKQGAMLRMKVDRSGDPIYRFMWVVFASVLAAPSADER